MRTAAPPRLLVSVRDAAEVAAAVAGGCDLLDIKEPSRGSLGMADAVTLRNIAVALEEFTSPPPLSIALGELQEWTADRSIPELPATTQYAKLGLAGAGENWQQDCNQLRDRFVQQHANVLQWVAVVYADWQNVSAPAPEEILQWGCETRCAGVLIDTCQKNGQSLFDVWDVHELQTFCTRVKETGLMLSLAGSLHQEDLPQAAALSPDVIAVRTSACSPPVRTGTVSTTAVAELKAMLCAQRSEVSS